MSRIELLAIMSAIIDTGEGVLDPVARAAAILHAIDAGTPEEAIERQKQLLEQARKRLEENLERRARTEARAIEDQRARERQAREQSHG